MCFHRVLGSLLFIITLFSGVCMAYPVQSSTTTYFGSVPVNTSGFSYSDENGNSIGESQTQYVPVVGTQINYTDGNWVWVQNGNVPANAAVYLYVNGFPQYYCRVQQNNQLFYGRLVLNEGCVLFDVSAPPFALYQVLLR